MLCSTKLLSWPAALGLPCPVLAKKKTEGCAYSVPRTQPVFLQDNAPGEAKLTDPCPTKRLGVVKPQMAHIPDFGQKPFPLW